MRDFFNGLKVVELASVLAGPAVGSFFAELGASVTKVENKRSGGDVTRGWRVQGEPTEELSAYYSSVNYGKESVMLDLTNEHDLSEMETLVKDADIVVSNYLPRVAEKFAVDYDSIKKENPSVIYLDLVGYEKESRPAYDVVLQAETGWISMTGTDANNPAKLPVALIDILAGHQLKEAALLALLHREKAGEGSYTRCSLEASSLSALANQASNYLMVDKVAKPIGTAHPNIAPYGDWFETQDGTRFVLAVGSENHFLELALAFEAKHLVENSKYSSNRLRVENRAALINDLAKIFKHLSFKEIERKMRDRGIPFGEIKSLDKVLSEQTARNFILEETQEGTKTKRLSAIAFKTSF
ncbi:MAG: CoA transferase [Flavobacteriales bacterium]|nr:CoA transferase [Flavobacteriales bacterium]